MNYKLTNWLKNVAAKHIVKNTYFLIYNINYAVSFIRILFMTSYHLTCGYIYSQSISKILAFAEIHIIQDVIVFIAMIVLHYKAIVYGQTKINKNIIAEIFYCPMNFRGPLFRCAPSIIAHRSMIWNSHNYNAAVGFRFSLNQDIENYIWRSLTSS